MPAPRHPQHVRRRLPRRCSPRSAARHLCPPRASNSPFIRPSWRLSRRPWWRSWRLSRSARRPWRSDRAPRMVLTLYAGYPGAPGGAPGGYPGALAFALQVPVRPAYLAIVGAPGGYPGAPGGAPGYPGGMAKPMSCRAVGLNPPRSRCQASWRPRRLSRSAWCPRRLPRPARRPRRLPRPARYAIASDLTVCSAHTEIHGHCAGGCHLL